MMVQHLLGVVVQIRLN